MCAKKGIICEKHFDAEREEMRDLRSRGRLNFALWFCNYKSVICNETRRAIILSDWLMAKQV